jgi:hypothetical protein
MIDDYYRRVVEAVELYAVERNDAIAIYNEEHERITALLNDLNVQHAEKMRNIQDRLNEAMKRARVESLSPTT